MGSYVEKVLSVRAGVGCDTSKLSLVEQVTLVVKGRDRTQVDASDGKDPPGAKEFESDWDEIADRCKQDCGIKMYRWWGLW